MAEELRGPAYVVPYDEIARRTAEAWDRGATEVRQEAARQAWVHGSREAPRQRRASRVA